MNDILRIISRIGLELPPPHLLWVIAGAVAVLGAATIAAKLLQRKRGKART